MTGVIMTGVVRFVSPRGFGFIRCEDGTDVYFLRQDPRELQVPPPRPGDAVDFRVVLGRRGRQAEGVVRRAAPPAAPPATPSGA